MTTPDYRAELQGLLDACESFADPVIGHGVPWRTALDRARAALAAQPQAPSYEEITDLWDCTHNFHADDDSHETVVLAFAAKLLARYGTVASQSQAPGLEDEPTLQEEALVALERIRSGDASNGNDDFLFVECALRERARYSAATPAPVPVGERLPGVGDCDADGRCWWWDDDDDMWRLNENTIRLLCWTHWLPHWAVPFPEVKP